MKRNEECVMRKFGTIIQFVFAAVMIFISLAIYLSLFVLKLPISTELNRLLLLLTYAICIGFSYRVLVSHNRNQYQKTIWLLLLLLTPALGLMLYIVFGKNYLEIRKFQKKMSVKQNDTYDMDYLIRERLKETEHRTCILPKDVHQIQRLANTSLYEGCDIEVLTDGESKFPKLHEALRRAKHTIHMEYFIFEDDDTGKEVFEILYEKCREGVQVRVLVDTIGNLGVHRDCFRKLVSYGGEYVYFGKIGNPFFNDTLNFRNHRKIVVIDGKEAFFGGMNIGNEYYNRNPKYPHWRDTHFYTTGPLVYELQKIFLLDYMSESKKEFHEDEIVSFFPKLTFSKYEKDTYQGMILNGPEDAYPSATKVIIDAIYNAKKSVYLTTPYFIPDEGLKSAIKIAARKGLDVKIIIPGFADKKSVYFVTKSNIAWLLEEGVEVYMLQDTFIHSKVYLIDDDISFGGTINLDYRSLYLLFELTGYFKSEKITQRLKQDFENDMLHSKQITAEEWKNRSFFEKILENIMQLFTSFL